MSLFKVVHRLHVRCGGYRNILRTCDWIVKVRALKTASRCVSNQSATLRRRSYGAGVRVYTHTHTPQATVAAYGSLWHSAEALICTNQRRGVTIGRL